MRARSSVASCVPVLERPSPVAMAAGSAFPWELRLVPWSAAKWTAADGCMRCERGSERDPTHPFKQPRKNGSPPHL